MSTLSRTWRCLLVWGWITNKKNRMVPHTCNRMRRMGTRINFRSVVRAARVVTLVIMGDEKLPLLRVSLRIWAKTWLCFTVTIVEQCRLHSVLQSRWETFSWTRSSLFISGGILVPPSPIRARRRGSGLGENLPTALLHRVWTTTVQHGLR